MITVGTMRGMIKEAIMKKNGLKAICALLAVGCMATLVTAVNQINFASASEIENSNPIIVSGEGINYSVRAVSVRIVDDEYGAGVRFKVAMDKDVFEENLMEDPDNDGVKTMKTNVATGTLLIPEYTLGGNELTIAYRDKAAVRRVTFNEENIDLIRLAVKL